VSGITFGQPWPVDGPLPVAPKRCLLSVPGVLQDTSSLPESERSRWMNGVSVYGYPDGLAEVWDPCASGTYGDKSDASSFNTPDFASFVAYLPITCSSFSLAHDPEGFGKRAEIALDAIVSYAVERALSQGAPMTTNPYLADANVDVLASGAAVTPNAGLAYLEDAIGQTARAGMIHATPGVVTSWFASFPLPENESTLYTPAGTVVSSGGGYAGATPTGESAAAAGQSWAYATGPVKAWVAPETMLNIRDVLERGSNDVPFRAERYVLVEWDVSLQAAVLIDWAEQCWCV